MTISFAKEIAEHLVKTNQGFCFTTYGLISREYLTENFNIDFTKPIYNHPFTEIELDIAR
jgi:hypothetical protein